MMAKIKQAATVAACSALMFGSTLAFADGPAPAPAVKGVDLSPLTNSVNFTTVLTGIMAVAGSLIVLYAGSAGVRWILRMVRGA